MNGLYHAALEIQEFCQQRDWQFCFIGGLALLRWGDPRQTLDVDLTLLTGFEGEEEVVNDLLNTFPPRRPNALEFAIQARVVLIAATNNVPVDISLGGLPFEEAMVARASAFEYLPGVNLITASAEDLVILKAFAGRDKDWVDVENILVRQTGALNWNVIVDGLAGLCELKESPETVDRLLQLRDRLASE